MASVTLPDPAAAARVYAQLLKYSRRDADILENYFTECFAAAITEDQLLARAVIKQLVRRPGIAGVSLASATVVAYTQVHVGPRAIPDVLLDIASPDRRRIVRLAIEAKLNASLGTGQLLKYLRQRSLAGVAFVTRHPTPVPTGVYDHRKYLRPPRGDHFFWTDFYPAVERRARSPRSPALSRALAGLFKHLRFQPPIRAIGELRPRGDERDRRLRIAFAARWTDTRKRLAAMGWQSNPGSQAQVYVYRPASLGRLSWALLDPMVPDHCLRVRFNFRSDRTLTQVRRELETSRFFLRRQTRFRERTVRRADGPHTVLDLEIPLRELFPEGTERPGHGGFLARYVISLFRRADRRARFA